MPKVDAGYLAARREQILDAALACFARKGFHETTIQDIASEAGLSHGALYRYFPSKDDIIEATSARDRRGREQRFQDAAAAAGSVDALDRILTAYVEEHATSDRDRWKLRVQLMGEALRNPRVHAVFQATWADAFDRLASLVRDGQERGEIDAELDPGCVARVISAVHNGLALQQTLDPTTDVAGCLEVVRALLRGGLRGDGGDGSLRRGADGGEEG
jgi:AcrR family transcriptional regulator